MANTTAYIGSYPGFLCNHLSHEPLARRQGAARLLGTRTPVSKHRISTHHTVRVRFFPRLYHPVLHGPPGIDTDCLFMHCEQFGGPSFRKRT